MADAPESPLWEELKSLLRLAAGVFGEPASLLEERVMARREALLLRSWIAALETVARALLALMASRLPDLPPARRRAARAPRAPERVVTPSRDVASAATEPPGSERWAGVAFRLPPRRRSGARGARHGPRRFLSTRSLAYRFEALIRVAEAPLPFARRIARRLRADPALTPGILAPPKGGGDGPPPYAGLAIEALAAARAALAPPPAPDTG